MGLLQSVFGRNKQDVASTVATYLKTLNGYAPVFTSRDGGVYEMELTRSAIDTFARHVSKLTPTIKGDNAEEYKELACKLLHTPNDYMSTSQFLYKVATLYETQNNVFIIPMFNKYGELNGYYPIAPSSCEVVDVYGVLYLRYSFTSGQKASIEYNKVGILRKFYYKDDFFGESNEPLMTTLNLIHANNQGIVNAIKTSAIISFIGKIGSVLKPEDVKKKRNEFAEDNLTEENTTGLLLYDNTFTDLKQVETKQFTINPLQVTHIKNNVFDYFGTNEKIIQNSYNEDEFKSYYEGKIEPFITELSQVLTKMTFTDAEIENGLSLILADSKLEFANSNLKLQISVQLFDRGILSTNQVMDMWGFANVEDGDKRYIRKEYTETSKLHEEKEGGGEE